MKLIKKIPVKMTKDYDLNQQSQTLCIYAHQLSVGVICVIDMAWVSPLNKMNQWEVR